MDSLTNARQADSRDAGSAATDGQWANAEMLTIARTLADLQDRLEKTNALLASTARVETTAVEAGRLFEEAQRFVRTSLSKEASRIDEALREATVRAVQIVAEATAEGQEIRRQAQQEAWVSTATARELRAAIMAFTEVNGELLKELESLNAKLRTEPSD